MHEHDHGHSDAHVHVSDNVDKLGFSVWFTLAVFVAEVVGGYLTNSLALLSDAWHVLADVMALALSWWALKKARQSATGDMTYGYHRYGVLAALANGFSLLLLSFWILYEAYGRFLHPEPVKTIPMLVVAVIGLVANAVVALALGDSAHANLNVRSAFLHVLGDALSSVGVIVAAVVMKYTSWYAADPLISVGIALLILKGASDVLRSAIGVLAERSPEGMDAAAISRAVSNLPFVLDVHDVHLWSLSTELPLLSMHVVTDSAGSTNADLLRQINEVLLQNFGLRHSVVQLEEECCGRSGLLCDLK